MQTDGAAAQVPFTQNEEEQKVNKQINKCVLNKPF